MPRISFAFNTILGSTNIADAQGNELSAEELGLTFELSAGMGPLEFTITPSNNVRYSINDLLNGLAKTLNIPVLSKVTQLTSKKPWSLIFETQVTPSLRVLASKSNKAISLILTLYKDKTTPDSGITLGGKYGPITIEPIFTVFEIIIGYNQSKGGLDLSAKVTFQDQKDTKVLMQTGIDANGQEKKTEVVKFPFPVPDQGNSLFKVNYVGLGQRFGPPLPTDPNKFSTALETIFTDLQKNLTTNNPQEILVDLVKNYYHPDRGWFIAADLEVKGWQIRFIFNDPVLYGLQVSCKVPNFKGLDLIILYIKLGPHLGVYYGKLTIPEQYRQLNFGAVALTLPTIQIWIYTNGDFKINVGWPLGSESIGIEVYIFTGGCGFYFGKLRSGDLPQNPAPPVPYNPIIIFGLGVWFGLGRSIRKGPLSASLSLTLQGTFQGILAWEEGKGSISRAPDYFWFAATVGLVGTLQGAVDLKIIKISILVRLSVTAGVAFETDYNTVVNVVADVEVKASVKILFIKISVGFKARISHTFVLTSGGKGDASLNGPQNPSFAGLNGGGPGDRLDTFIRATPQDEFVMVNEALFATEEAVKIGLSFLLYPAVVFDQTEGDGAKAVAILSIDNEGADGATSEWEKLMNAYASWLLTNFSEGTTSWQKVIEQLNENGNNPPDGFDKKLVEDFLANDIEFEITGIDLSPAEMAATENEEKSVTFFPILPNLEMNYDGDGGTPAKFSAPKVSVDFLDDLQKYFGKFSVENLTSNAEAFQTDRMMLAAFLAGQVSFNGLMFTDYFLMAGRQLAQQMADETPTTATPSTAIALNVGGFVSRFLLHGLVVPKTIGSDEVDGLYQFSLQQFPVDSTKPSASATLAKDSSYQPGAGEPDFNKIPITIATGKAVIPLIAPPTAAPAFIGEPTLPAPLNGAPLWVAVRERTPWEPKDQAAEFIVPLPTRVKTTLLNGQALKLITQSEYPHNGHTGTPIPTNPGLMIQLPIRQVKQPILFNVDDEGTTRPNNLPNVFQIGSTDDETRDLIEMALKSSDLANATITLLYNSSKNGYLSDTQNPDETVLFKTNLSTTSEPDSPLTALLFNRFTENSDIDLGPVSAKQNAVQQFLRLVWENSVVNSTGFFLYYNDAKKASFPDSIFENAQADLQILVTLPTGSNFQPWNNVLTLASAGIKNSLYLGVNDAQGNPYLDYQPAYPTGSFAFELPSPVDLLADTDDGDNIPYSKENIDQLYHLMQYQIPADADSGLVASGWSPAVGPSSEQSQSLGAISPDDLPKATVDAPESYRQVVPVYNFLKDTASVIDDQLPNVYAAVGKTSKIEFRLADVYGNTLAKAATAPQFTTLYTDPLLSIAEWPGVHVAYNFKAGSEGVSPALALQLAFNPKQVIRDFDNNAYFVDRADLSGLSDQQESAKQQAEIALFKLFIILNQLGDENVQLALSTTLFQTDCSLVDNRGKVIATQTELKTKLIDFGKNIITEIQKVLTGGTPEALNTSIDTPITPSDITQVPCDILPLTVWFSISRDKFLPANVENLPKVKENAFVVKPDLEEPDAESSTGEPGVVTLTQFASNFEKIFTGFDGADGIVSMASRTGNANFSATGNSTYLWVFKWSTTKGVNVKFTEDQFNYFTLAPLSNELLPSEQAQITTYDADLKPSTETSTFSDIDIDAFAQDFLNSVDEILTPEIGAAIAQVDPANYASIMTAKARMASALKENLIPIFDNQQNEDLDSAKDRFEQAMLVQLIRAYTTSAVVQTKAEVSVANQVEGGNDSAPRIFGNIGTPRAGNAAPTNEKEYTLSNAKLELGASSGTTKAEYLNFLAIAKNPAEQADLSLDLEYNPVFIEHLVNTNEEDFGYVPSSWLRFVNSGPGTRTQYLLGTANIPIPLREFPLNPTLEGQAAKAEKSKSELMALIAAAQGNPVEEALNWKYTATIVDEKVAAQDEIWFDLKYNLPVTSLAGMQAFLEEGVPPLVQLFRQLAMFNNSYASLRSLFLAQVDALINNEAADQLAAIIKIIAPLINNAAQAYEDLLKPQPGLFFAEDPTIITRHFVLSLKEVFAKKTLTLFGDIDQLSEFPNSINGASPNGVPEKVEPQEAPGPGTWYKLVYPFEEDQKNKGRLAFQWVGLNAIERQTAKTIYWIRRNADLGSGDQTVNEKLIYQTAEITFANPILPLLSVADIEVPAEADLQATLYNIFEPFAKAGTASTKSRLLKVEANFSYNLLNFLEVNDMQLSVPTTARLSYDLNLTPNQTGSGDTIDLNAFSCGLAQDLTAWHDKNKPAQIPSTFSSFLHFNVTLFAVIDNSQLPLIIVKNIYVPVPNVGGIGWWDIICPKKTTMKFINEIDASIDPHGTSVALLKGTEVDPIRLSPHMSVTYTIKSPRSMFTINNLSAQFPLTLDFRVREDPSQDKIIHMPLNSPNPIRMVGEWDGMQVIFSNISQEAATALIFLESM